ncbi:MAG: SGNH/GDSL hydrolase family protein [Verrucomicrobiota bacterium]
MAELKPTETPDLPFVNEVRLRLPHWAVAFGIILLVVTLTPSVWKKIEHFATGTDYRIPYALSKDYWLYQQRLRRMAPTNIVVLGDSVVWGEYVLPDGTWSHFLNQEIGATNRFINAGVNGLFPLALEGLVRCYGRPLSGQKVILHCNLLWLTSPKADLSTAKEESFNHASLVPQFFPRIPCYRADASDRLNVIVERNVPFFAWVGHLQNAYFGQQSIPKWTLAEAGGDPPRYPNVYRNPFSQISLTVPSEPLDDPQRGPLSPRHKPWSTNASGSTQFEWVALDQSLQWQAFQRTVQVLRARDNAVFVVLGPFNEHLMAPENRPAYRQIHGEIAAWLARNQIPHWIPEPLPSALYADASHPLTEGYQLLAKRLGGDTLFQTWLSAK